MSKYIKEKDSNSPLRYGIDAKFIHLFLFVLSGRLFLQFYSAFSGSVLGVSSTSNISMAFYGVSCVILYFQFFAYCERKLQGVAILFIIYGIYAVNYLFISSEKTYFTDMGMIICYLFYFPLAIFIISNIKDWSPLSQIGIKYIRFDLCIGILTSLVSIIFRSERLTTNSNYMVYSYTVLPIICLALYLNSKKKNLFLLLLALCNIVLIIVYGSRMCVGLALVCYMILTFQKAGRVRKAFYILVAIIVVLSFSGLLSQWQTSERVQNIANSTDSYILKRIMNGTLLDLGDREQIYAIAQKAISEMKWNIYGFYADRKILFGITTYCHNIVYQILLSMGWILGIAFMTVLLVLIVVAFTNAKRNGFGSLYLIFLISLFLKFFISGSYLTDGAFAIFLGVTASFSSINRTTNRSGTRYCKEGSNGWKGAE